MNIKKLNKFAVEHNLYLFVSVIFAVLIFIGSTIPQISQEEEKIINNSGIIPHLVAYFMLSLAVSLHLLNAANKPFLKAVLLSGSYGLFIEIIQFFIPYRHFQAFDIFINFTGAFLVLFLGYFIKKLF